MGYVRCKMCGRPIVRADVGFAEIMNKMRVHYAKVHTQKIPQISAKIIDRR